MRARSIWLLSSLALGLGLGACRLPNPDHCFNRAEDPDGWCAEQFGGEGRAICSPCDYDEIYLGCVEQAPGECSLYSTGTGTETGTETGT